MFARHGTPAKIVKFATVITAAVEEQDSVAREMAANMEIAAQGVAAIDSSANLIAPATEGVETSVRDAARQLVA